MLSSLLAAVNHDQGKVIRTILNEGLEPVGGIEVLPVAAKSVLDGRKVRFLQMLLEYEGGKVYGESATEVLLSYVGNTNLDNQTAAMRRILERAPACRARSWAWPVDAAGPDVSGADASVKAPFGVSIVRPMNEKFFTVRLTR